MTYLTCLVSGLNGASFFMPLRQHSTVFYLFVAYPPIRRNNSPFDAWLITPCLDIENAASKILTFRTQVAGYGSTTSKFEVYILNSKKPEDATVKVKLNPAIATPTGGSPVYSDWKESGDVDLSQWADGCYYIGFRFYATADENYATWCVDDVTFGIPPKLPTSSDFETMPAHTTSLGNYTSTAGWAANNCTLLEGGAADGNPVFTFIGYALGSTSVYAKAPTMNGGTATTGSIVSPVLKGGMTKLRFNYGSAYSGKLLAFRVDVKQNGNVVKTWTINDTNVTQKHAYSFEESCSVQGDFTIEFTNLCPSNATGNKDRASIWNVNWDPAN